MKNRKEYLRSWRASNKEHRAAYHREYKFGLTQEQYDAMLVDQDFKCAVCRTDDPGLKRGWSVDHCHATNKVRGLLCNSCNLGLGQFRDNPSIIASAISYLIRNNVS
jgi:Recombination endonuclease VII